MDIRIAISPTGGESLGWVRVDVIVHVGKGFSKGPGLDFGLRRALACALWGGLTFALWGAMAFALWMGLAFAFALLGAFTLRRAMSFALLWAFGLLSAMAFALLRAMAFALLRAFALRTLGALLKPNVVPGKVFQCSRLSGRNKKSSKFIYPPTKPTRTWWQNMLFASLGGPRWYAHICCPARCHVKKTYSQKQFLLEHHWNTAGTSYWNVAGTSTLQQEQSTR